MAELAFRPLQDRDVEPTVELWRRCGLVRPQNDPYQDIALARGKTTSDILVGIRETAVLAAILVGHDGHHGIFHYVAVAPEYRRCGYGKETIRAGEHWLRRRGVQNVNLLVRTDSAAVGRFYEQLGYTVDPVFSMGRRILAGQRRPSLPGGGTA